MDDVMRVIAGHCRFRYLPKTGINKNPTLKVQLIWVLVHLTLFFVLTKFKGLRYVDSVIVVINHYFAKFG